MRLLHLVWPHLPLRLELARQGLPWTPETPLVLGGQPWDPGAVLDRSPAAARPRVRPGPPLEADPAAPAFGRAILGIEGLDRLWGDEATLTARARAAVASLLPTEPRAGIGDTRFGAAVAAALATRDAPLVAILPGGAAEEAAFLAPLPIGLLPAPELEQRFALFGLRRMGELAALPRSAVVARFGSLGGELHDLARGLDGRPLRPRRPIERLRAEIGLNPPGESRDALRFVLHHLAGALCAQLAARGAGAAH